MSLIYESIAGRPLQFVYPDYRNYQYSNTGLVYNTLTQLQVPIPAKFSSLKSLFLTFRDQYNIATYFPYSSVTKGLVDYQFRIGASVMPSKAPTSTINGVPAASYVEHFAELLKAIGNISDLMHTPSIEKASYTLPTSIALNDTNAATCTTSSGSFYIGIDLENYAAASKDSLFAGMNTNTDDIYCVANFINPVAGNPNIRIDCYALFDCVFICENNTAYVRF
jgi:hypothetical protein